MIDTRDVEAVTNWLKTYPNIAFVSRDGSALYASAIRNAHPTAVQISDRFHLVKNLLQASEQYFTNILNRNIIIPTTVEYSFPKYKTLEQKYLAVAQMISYGTPLTKACKKENLDVRSFIKLKNIPAEEQVGRFYTKVELQSRKRLARKEKLVSQIRTMYHEGNSQRQIAKVIGINKATVKKYMHEHTTITHSAIGQKKESIFYPHLELINQVYCKRIKPQEILTKLRRVGYSGSESTLRQYLSKMKKDLSTIRDAEEVIKRKHIKKLLYCDLKDINHLNRHQLLRVYDKMPIVKKIIELTRKFRHIIKSNRVEELKHWIDCISKLNIQEYDSFISSTLKDIDDIEKAIKYKYSNGVAEGSVNKIKLIKRIMYGRSSFETWRIKPLRLELMRIIN